MTFIDAIMWVFVAIFAIAALISLSDMIGVVTIRDADQRKWLFRSLIGAVVLAVGSFGARQLTNAAPTVQTSPKVTATETSKPVSKPNARPATTPTPTPSSSPMLQPSDRLAIPAPPASAAPSCAKSDADLNWATQQLGPRPTIADTFDREYPACVASLRAVAAVDEDAAANCRAALEVHKSQYLSPFFVAKASYDDKLRREERAIRTGGISETELPFYNYVVCENESFNFDGGKDLERLNAAEARLNEDIKSCRSRGCK
ncbi:MAG: hypothetical protein K2X59_06430 [Sphingomonas sp.]|nr:hypothetical protein [Sphingomonas sp.]